MLDWFIVRCSGYHRSAGPLCGARSAWHSAKVPPPKRRACP